MLFVLPILAPVLLFILFTVLILILAKKVRDINQARIKAVGNAGEEYATRIISSVLREGDYLFTNVSIEYDGKPAELDIVIVNECGVFIIEVKNYSGWLQGSEEDFEWIKYHESHSGNIYTKAVKNPIKQVKRQVFVLAKYLDYYGVKTWVNGYAMIMGAECPVDSDLILTDSNQIDRAIHSRKKNGLSKEMVDMVCALLQ